MDLKSNKGKKMTLKTVIKGAIPVAVGVSVLALALRYFGDKPLLEDIKKGLNGDSVGIFN